MPWLRAHSAGVVHMIVGNGKRLLQSLDGIIARQGEKRVGFVYHRAITSFVIQDMLFIFIVHTKDFPAVRGGDFAAADIRIAFIIICSAPATGCPSH